MTVTLAFGLDFNKKVSFSKATFPPPTIKTSSVETFKKTGYNSFVFKIVNISIKVLKSLLLIIIKLLIYRFASSHSF